MKTKQYQQMRAGVAMFVSVIVSVATLRKSYVLALVGVAVGMAFLAIARSRTAVSVDEREVAVREKAAQTTYAIFAPTIAIGSMFLIMFSRGEYYFLESLGMVFAYLSLFLIALYALSYHYFNRKYGGGSGEE